jgi:glucokinase
MPDARVIAIDLGGTRVRAALFEGDRILGRAVARTDIAGGPEAVMAQIELLVAEARAGDGSKAIQGIGICSAGPLDTGAGRILGIPTIPGWENFPIVGELSRRMGLEVLLENDAIAAAFGEWRRGAGRGLSHMAYVTVSTGIGGGAVVDGRLIHGSKGMAGHFGHIRLAQDGPRCACGAIGCFEAFASGTALGRRARDAAGEFPDTYLGNAAKRGSVEASDVIDGARAGDPTCLKLVCEEARYLGQGITSIIHALSPQCVVMGGGLSHAFDLFEVGIHEVIASDAMPPFRHVRVVRAELGDNSGLAGIAAMVVERVASKA